MPVELFTIEEMTGSRRKVELLGRALPYRGVNFPVEQRSERSYYPGNPVATIQVLGVSDRDVEITGRWMDRYVGSAARLTGWDSIVSSGAVITAQNLADVFDAICRAGNLSELRWGPKVLRGLLKSFEPTYNRTDQIRWKATFETAQKGRVEAQRVTSARSTSTGLITAEAALAMIIASAPPGMITAISDAVLIAAALAQAAAISLVRKNAEISGVPEVEATDYQDVTSYTSQVVESCVTLKNTIEIPAIGIIPSDEMATVVQAQVWSANVAGAASSMASEAIKVRDAIKVKVVADYIADIRLREGQTLRNIAVKYYDSSDSWKIIADANGLVGTSHPAGTRVMVPRKR